MASQHKEYAWSLTREKYKVKQLRFYTKGGKARTGILEIVRKETGKSGIFRFQDFNVCLEDGEAIIHFTLVSQNRTIYCSYDGPMTLRASDKGT